MSKKRKGLSITELNRRAQQSLKVNYLSDGQGSYIKAIKINKNGWKIT